MEFSRAASFVDPGRDEWKGTVDFGDGPGETLSLNSDKTFDLKHTYTTNGAYTVKVKIDDSHGGMAYPSSP